MGNRLQVPTNSREIPAPLTVRKVKFAEICNVSPARVAQWIKEARVWGPALIGTGSQSRIVVDIAQAQLRQSLDADQVLANGSATQLGTAPAAPPLIRSEDEARAALQFIYRVLADEGIVPGADGLTLSYVRMAEGILQARERALKIDERRKKLVDLERVKVQVFDLARTMRNTWQGLPARQAAVMAAKVGCNTHDLEVELTRVIRETLFELAEPTIRG